MEETPIQVFEPHELGWLRRPELECFGYQVWEKPCGELLAAPPGVRLRVPKFGRFDVCQPIR